MYGHISQDIYIDSYVMPFIQDHTNGNVLMYALFGVRGTCPAIGNTSGGAAYLNSGTGLNVNQASEQYPFTYT